MSQTIFKKIDYPMHLRKSILSLALETAHLNSNLKTLILDKKIKLETYNKIKLNINEANEMLTKLEKEYLKEINDSKVDKYKDKGFKPKFKPKSDEDYSLIKEINEIREKLARL